MVMNSKQEVIVSVVAYSLCSGTLVLLNKLTLHYLPFPSLVVAIQLFACVGIIYSMKFTQLIQVDVIAWQNVKPYILYILFFSTGVYANMRSLSTSNVETVIVFRALSPMLVAFLDALFLGREWPSQRSWAGLSILVLGAYGYASFDEQFQVQGYTAYIWPTIYTGIIALEMAYGKRIVKSVPLVTKFGPVLYTNLIGFPPMLLLATVGDEYTKFYDYLWINDGSQHVPTVAIALLIAGSLVGTGIGYTGWWCRSVVSATSYTLIGVLNKCLTVILNTLIWDQHANLGGIICLLVCIAGGLIYQQAPMRQNGSDGKAMTEISSSSSTKHDTNKDKEMTDLLLETFDPVDNKK